MAATVVEHADRGDRGTLTVRDRAVSHVVEYAACGVTGVVRQAGRMVGRSALPRVDAEVSGSRVRVRIAVATTWPLSVSSVSADVRDTVAHQLERCTGLAVDQVDVVVDEVVLEEAGRARRKLL